MIKNIFVDLDDTLWDTFNNNKECLNEVYADLGWGRHFASFETFFEKYYCINDRLWGEYRKGLINKNELTLTRFREPLEGVISLTDEEILMINDRFLASSASKTGVVEGALEVLEYLHNRYKIVVVSNGFREVQDAKLRNSGLAPFVDFMVLSEDVGINKPHKMIFDRALSTCRGRRAETVMIGDSWDADIVGAHNAKIPSVWFNPYKLNMPEDGTTRPVRQIAKLRDCLEFL
ncbi:YjjG family noncanonical pyrimidine nucleotidase [Falsiporphyromonas endometrii]|uniref:YjjG family noncanonical pyrimidine nucleotidase n=1 Tax=Falsiporphyromonas endometrii TaxID=1387297 RepID=A0ABV9K8H1_9PORP